MVQEVEKVLTEVVFKVTRDTSVEIELRKKRAEALVLAGEVLGKLTADAAGEVDDFKERLGHAAV